jgi:hypothetical protein
MSGVIVIMACTFGCCQLLRCIGGDLGVEIFDLGFAKDAICRSIFGKKLVRISTYIQVLLAGDL